MCVQICAQRDDHGAHTHMAKPPKQHALAGDRADKVIWLQTTRYFVIPVFWGNIENIYLPTRFVFYTNKRIRQKSI
jgi:hypothetical protein